MDKTEVGRIRQKAFLVEQILKMENLIDNVISAEDNNVRFHRCIKILNDSIPSNQKYSSTMFVARIADSTLSLLLDLKASLEKEFDEV